MANKHFFKPLLPGFRSHLTIPLAFFSKHIEARNEQKTVELRSDASKLIWKVKIDGRTLTDGWKEFAVAHDLRTGDILIFRQERDMDFHVTIIGPSCCEIQYESCLDDQNNLENIQSNKKVKKNPKREAESSSLDPSCFVANVAPSTLRYDSLHLPRSFARANGLETRSGEIVLMNEKGKSWILELKPKNLSGTTCIKRGWKSFCDANGLRAGDTFTFKLMQRGATLVLHLSPKETEEETNEVSLSTEPGSDEENNIGKIQRKKNQRREAESNSLDPSCFVAYISPSTLRYDTLYLPMSFVRANGVDTGRGEMILMNEMGRSWTVDLKRKNLYGTTYIKRGWRSFCESNGLRARDYVTFKLIQTGGTLVLRLTLKEPEEEEESSQGERISQEVSRRKEKKGKLMREASSSQSQNRLVTLTLRPYNITTSKLRLPVPFTKINGINEETKVTLLDKDGVKWPIILRCDDRRSKRMRMIGGWKGFLKANCVQTNESIMLELIWEKDTSCVLKFCSKVKQETE